MPEPSDLFAAAHYAGVRRPVEQASNLPPWCYTSEAFFAREVERIFRKEWNFVGRAERIPKPGDYFAVEIAGVPVLIVRGADDAVRAFSNICRHRGCIVARGEGNRGQFVCPYHAWTYALSGELVAAPTDM